MTKISLVFTKIQLNHKKRDLTDINAHGKIHQPEVILLAQEHSLREINITKS